MSEAAWLLQVNGYDVRLELPFCEGRTFESGLPVGIYEQVGTSFLATIGEEMRLIVDLMSMEPAKLGVRVLTKRDGRLLDERGSLYRTAWN